MTTPHRPSRALPLALLATLGVSLVGCGSTKAPTLRVADTRVLEQTDEGLSMVFLMEGTNDNTEEIPLQRVVYSLSIDGQRVFQGERMAEATLRRLGTQTFALPVSARWDQLPERSRQPGDPERVFEYRLSGSLQYIAPGALAEVFFDAGVRRPSLRFSIEGELVFSDEGASVR